jgi:methylated-DNA-protein-cysteine methyltransferase-like protein
MKTAPLTEKNKDFFDLVHEVVKLIPKGRVTTYGAIASYLGSARSSRMVGWAMNASHKIEGIPAHRVVNRIGLLTGKMNFETPTLMEERLKQEGIHVINDQIEGFKQLFWDPTIELNIH